MKVSWRGSGKRTSGGIIEEVYVRVIAGVAFGFFLGVSYRALTSHHYKQNVWNSGVVNTAPNQNLTNSSKIWVTSNPRGAERLLPQIVVSNSDLYLRRLWGNPMEDLIEKKPKYLAAFAVGYNQKNMVDAAVKKFSDNFTILLFHYDGLTSEWDEFEWSKKAIHVSASQQTKWWFAKRFMHPDIVAPYEYIFLWDEDFGVAHFDAEEYIKLVKKYGLEISQPALEPQEGVYLTYQITRRVQGMEIHKELRERSSVPGEPQDSFIEIMAPVFSRNAWRCVWHMIQNDLVHGWGFDCNFRRCVEPLSKEKMGVVDAQSIVHQSIPTLSGDMKNQTVNRTHVRERCQREEKMFYGRMYTAEYAYNESLKVKNTQH
ncbi:hypothetical protein DM860_007911 [Cuscuta australis]|uniref:Uncharacterized protein n=1 Tax=Cuscuta australis TaxID=267555 RepID=A0A328DWX2_9ASTE|nr:hypothetical protein DM860_007911 [Cuscuta australis]